MNTQPQDLDWSARAAALTPDGRWFCEGERRASLSGNFDKHSPLDGRRLGAVTRGAGPEIDLAVASARRAFDDGRWAAQSPAARKRVLLRLAELLLAHREELALLECLDMGKPVRNAWQVDVPGAARCLQWTAEAIDKVYGEIAPTAANALALVQREPVGVVAAIVPWNYPLLMAVWKLAPALATGNSVVLKPSEKSPFSALRLAELAVQAGLPPGVLNAVPGYGAEAGEALALHLQVDALGFTGSTATGRRMLQYAGQSNLKRVSNELGGKSAFLVFADCADFKRAAQTCAASMFFNSGQSCNAPSRLLVQQGVPDAFYDALLTHTRRFALGDPLRWDTAMGPLVDAQQQQRVLGHIEAGRREGARLLIGGGQQGLGVEATVFDAVQPGMQIEREEIFGPVLSLLRFEDEAQALQIANDSPYGLQASVWTEQLSRAHRVARQLRAGTVHVNQYDDDDMTVPFGGFKQSGNGRDKSLHAFDKVTDLKTTWIRLD